MRTTIDLDPDVDARLRGLAKERGVSLRTVINDVLREAAHPAARPVTPYRQPTFALGLRPGINLDRALALDAELEDQELVRKLALRT